MGNFPNKIAIIHNETRKLALEVDCGTKELILAVLFQHPLDFHVQSV